MGDFFNQFKDKINSLLPDQVNQLLSSKKNIINLLILGIMILGIPLTVGLLRQRQILKSRATVEPIVFVTSNDVFRRSDGTWVTKKPQLSIQVTSPLGPPPGSPAPSPSQPPSQSPSPSRPPGASPPPSQSLRVISYEAFKYDGSNAQKIVQSIIAENNNSWSRTCSVSGDSVSCPNSGTGTERGWTNNGAFGAPDSSSARIISYGAFAYTGSGGQKVVQSLIADNGIAWTRTCTVSGDNVSCPNSGAGTERGWTNNGTFSVPGGLGEIRSYEAFAYTGSSGQKVVQSLLLHNKLSLSRTCAVSGDSVSCPNNGGSAGNGWNNDGVFNAPDGSSAVIISYGAFAYTGSGGQKVVQSLIADNGIAWTRTCTVSGDNVSCPNSGAGTERGWTNNGVFNAP